MGTQHSDAWQLLDPRDSGPDGAAFQAKRRDDGKTGLLHFLSAARATERWPLLHQRIQRVGLASHHALLQPLDGNLDVAAPWLVTPDVNPWTSRPESDAAACCAIAARIAGALAAAHSVGVLAGPHLLACLVENEGGEPMLDLLDVRTSARAAASTSEWDAGEDARVFGAWVEAILVGHEVPQDITALLRAMRSDDPGARPSMQEAARILGLMTEQTRVSQGATESENTRVAVQREPPPDEKPVYLAPGKRVGRFEIQSHLGSGGMGEVYRAVDVTSGQAVAIKVLRPELAARREMLRRFLKECRLLSRVTGPNIANLVEANQDGDLTFMAIEFVDGESLGAVLKREKLFEERIALSVVAEVGRALAEPHRRGIIHRDIKPDNVMVMGPLRADAPVRLKLCDFGIAREVDQTQSMQLTSQGVFVGTPAYASPEQCQGQTVGPAADVYALGVMLFRMLAGQPPFPVDNVAQVLVAHVHQQPPNLREMGVPIGDATLRIVERALKKRPEDRFADAGELVDAIDRVLRGDEIPVRAHPVLPSAAPERLVGSELVLELKSRPEVLWPWVADVDQTTAAMGLPPVEIAFIPRPDGGSRHICTSKIAGVAQSYEELPFEWIENRRGGVIKRFEGGPVAWVAIVLTLTPRPDGGTTLQSTVTAEARNVLSRVMVQAVLDRKIVPSIREVMTRIDERLTARRTHGYFNAIFPPRPLDAASSQMLDKGLVHLRERGVEPGVADALGELLRQGSEFDVARIRPLAIAAQFDVDGGAMTDACMHGVHAGLLNLMWEVLCPLCRVPSRFESSLAAVKRHLHCPACARDFEIDPAQGVELSFRANPSVRHSDLRPFCSDAPSFARHVPVQVRLDGRERLSLPLQLADGPYILRSLQLPYRLEFRVMRQAFLSRADVELGKTPATMPGELRSGNQLLVVTNALESEIVLRIEHAGPNADALTAARACALPTFRKLFPTDVLAAGRLANMAVVNVLAVHFSGLAQLCQREGDSAGFSAMHAQLTDIDDVVNQFGGGVFRATEWGVLAQFDDGAAALDAARAVLGLDGRGLTRQAAVHRGPALAATIRDRFDYFGQTIQDACQLAEHNRYPGVLLTSNALELPSVARRLVGAGWIVTPGERGGVRVRFSSDERAVSKAPVN